MDKFESLLNAIEHPENYTPDELERMASDPETSEIYRALCAARSSAFSGNMLEEDSSLRCDRRCLSFNVGNRCFNEHENESCG